MSPKFALQRQQFAALLLAAKRGSSEAAGELLTAFQPMLVEYAHSRLCPELRRRFDPCDLAQFTLSQAIQRLGETRATSSRQFAAWLQAILRSRAARLTHRYVRRRDGQRRPRQLGLDPFLDEPGEDNEPKDNAGQGGRVLISEVPSPTESAIAREEAGAVRRMLEALPAISGQIVLLRIEHDLSFTAIGAALAISCEAARSRYRRAMIDLRRALKRHPVIDR
ncbi:MAG TPA: sigma-70 family RNA polymerase sigma factor [Pirellulales bacterium]|nr:sigma-70 family RNA polymerase sigma factor [Pirellulales bacterium]